MNESILHWPVTYRCSDCMTIPSIVYFSYKLRQPEMKKKRVYKVHIAQSIIYVVI